MLYMKKETHKHINVADLPRFQSTFVRLCTLCNQGLIYENTAKRIVLLLILEQITHLSQ